MADTASKFSSVVFILLTNTAAFSQTVPNQCGYDRWPVKILSDKDRGRVNFTRVETTVAKLSAIQIHEIPYPRDRRIEPEELKVYKIRAKLIAIKLEQDSDLHLIIADLDKPEMRMIAEIPAPACAEGTGHEEAYRKAREALSGITVGTIVEITGVGFFDFLHDTIGGARNGIELHPVLQLRRVETTSKTRN